MENMNDEYWVFNCFNNYFRRRLEPVTEEEAKGMYIAKERGFLEKSFGEEIVTQIFGAPSHLEKAEMLLLQIEDEKITQLERWENLIKVAYEISNACGELDSNNPVWEKYAILYCEIPIQMWQLKSETISQLSANSLEERSIMVSADFLNQMKTRIALKDEIPLDCKMEAHYEYIFNLVCISLKESLEDAKNELHKERK